MNKLTAIITTLVISSSTVALAQPAVRNHRDLAGGYSGAAYYNDHGRDRDRDGIPDRAEARWSRLRPVTLASNLRLSAHDRGASFVSLDTRFGSGFNRVRLSGDLNGRTFIDSVVLRFADGRTQAVSVRQVLSRRNPTVEIQTRGATGMFIRGSQMRGMGTVDVVGLRR